MIRDDDTGWWYEMIRDDDMRWWYEMMIRDDDIIWWYEMMIRDDDMILFKQIVTNSIRYDWVSASVSIYNTWKSDMTKPEPATESYTGLRWGRQLHRREEHSRLEDTRLRGEGRGNHLMIRSMVYDDTEYGIWWYGVWYMMIRSMRYDDTEYVRWSNYLIGKRLLCIEK